MVQLVWLVTGCTSGLGIHFVHSILARRDKVIATGRTLSQLQPLQAAGASILPLDVTRPQQDLDSIILQAISVYGRIDVLVNNAGYIAIGNWEDLQEEDWINQFNTNLFGTIKVTKALLPHFRERKSGWMVFISSLSGWIGHGSCGAYAASKFALEGAVESLHAETSPFGLRTLLIEPGRFRTNLLSPSKMKTSSTKISDYAAETDAKLEGLAKEDQNQPGDPEKLAEILVDVVRNEGIANGKEIPLRLPLGQDCFDDIKAKCEATLSSLDQWRTVSLSTDL